MLGPRGWAISGTMPADEEMCRGRDQGEIKQV